MEFLREYLAFEGAAAGEAIAALMHATGQLTFSGPRGLSLSFDLDGAAEELTGPKRLCGL